MLDDFDYALADAGLTRNLWDQLRSLAQKTSLKFVTRSRRPLRELCRAEESRTSDFWEIFYDTPIRVAALDDADRGGFLESLLAAGCTLDEPARKEIVAERAVVLIWNAELPPDKTLHAEWVRRWEEANVNYSHDDGKLPSSSRAQCRILRLATGIRTVAPLSRHITKTTCLLVLETAESRN